jgi:hypothetical protein
MGLIDVGNNQNGLNADTSYVALNATVNVPPGGSLPIGLPLSRNLLTYGGNYLSKIASVSGFSAYAFGDSFTTLPLSGAVASTTGASSTVGVYTGQPVSNPWLNPAAQTLNTSPLLSPATLARTGLRPVLCGLTNGGTTVKVGDFVRSTATVGTTSLYPFLLSQGGTSIAAGVTVGQVAATPIWTSVTANVGPGAAQVATVLNTNGITTTTPLTINVGQSNQETVTPTAVTATAPGLSTLTIVGTAGSASTVQITFNLAGYQGSTGVAPTGTATTTFTVSITIPNGSTLAQTTNIIVGALLATGFCFGAPQNINGIGSGSCTQTSAAGTAGNPASGPLVYVWSSAAGTIYFSAVNPGAWANSLLTYTVTVLNGTTQTYNGAVAGSATPVAFTGGVNGTFTATFQNAHVAGEPVYGIQNTSQGVIIPAPGTAGMLNCGLVYVDLVTA